MHWTYVDRATSSAEYDGDNLCQGDVLHRSPNLLRIIEEVHPHFSDAKYKAFMVVTQSCDLFRRADRCKAPYLTIAVIRTVEDALRHELRALDGREEMTLCGQAFVSERLRDRLQQITESLLNNTLDGYFFLRGDADAGVDGDWCSFLRVTIPLRVEHYNVLLEAKRVQLAQIFQAKVGWLVGSHYARVATPDWTQSAGDKDAQKALVRAYVHEAHEWLPDKQMQLVRRRLRDGNLPESEHIVRNLLTDPSTSVPSRRDLLLAALDKAWPPNTESLKRSTFIGRFQSQAEFREAVKTGN